MHHNLPIKPRSVDIGAAVDKMDNKLGACRCAAEWESVKETFLPKSERSQSDDDDHDDDNDADDADK